MISCEECKGACCREVSVEMDAPKSIEDWDLIRWMVAHDNVAVYQDQENDWLVEFKTKCSKLSAENRCTIYKVRPKLCSDYPLEDCLMNGTGTVEKIRFDTMEEVEKYIKEVVMPQMQKENEKNAKEFAEWKLSS